MEYLKNDLFATGELHDNFIKNKNNIFADIYTAAIKNRKAPNKGSIIEVGTYGGFFTIHLASICNHLTTIDLIRQSFKPCVRDNISHNKLKNINVIEESTENSIINHISNLIKTDNIDVFFLHPRFAHLEKEIRSLSVPGKYALILKCNGTDIDKIFLGLRDNKSKIFNPLLKEQEDNSPQEENKTFFTPSFPSVEEKVEEKVDKKTKTKPNPKPKAKRKRATKSKTQDK